MALDEHREAFTPTLFYLPEEHHTVAEINKQEKLESEAREEYRASRYNTELAKEAKADVQLKYNKVRRELIRMKESQKKPTELLQVWFPGVHINVGGGSNDTLKNEGDMEGEYLCSDDERSQY